MRKCHAQHGAGIVLNEDNLDQLLGEVERLIFDDELLGNFKSAMEAMDSFDAATAIAMISKAYLKEELEVRKLEVSSLLYLKEELEVRS